MRRSKIVHRGKYYDRTQDQRSIREKAFADQWELENTGTANSWVALSLLCTREATADDVPLFGSARVQNKLLTQRMATDAATIIQWLGSNVGFCFLEMALNRAGLTIVKKEAANGR